MTADNALYFPYINCPDNEWFFRILLYWDTVYSIVPPNILQDNGSLTPYMKTLLERGLVKTLDPRDFLIGENLAWNFISYLQRKKTSLDTEVKQSRSNVNGYSRIHLQKMDHVLVDFLHDQNYVKGGAYPDRGWLEVVTPVAEMYMTYLAVNIARTKTLKSSAVTPKSARFRMIKGGKNQDKSKRSEAEVKAVIRSQLMNLLLPSPESAELDEIQEFKEKHGKKLKKMRIEIERIILECASANDIQSMADRAIVEIADVKAKLGASEF